MWLVVAFVVLDHTPSGWFLGWDEPSRPLFPAFFHLRKISEAGDTLWRWDHPLPTCEALQDLSLAVTDSLVLVGFVANGYDPPQRQACSRMFVWKIHYPGGATERLTTPISIGCPDGWGFWRVARSFQPFWMGNQVMTVGNVYEIYADPGWGEVWTNGVL